MKMEPITVVLALVITAVMVMIFGLAMAVSYWAPSTAIPTKKVGIGSNVRIGDFDVNGTLNPGEAVVFHNATTVKRAGVTDPLCIGLSDVNENARKRYSDPMTTAFDTATYYDPCTVIISGFVVATSDAGGANTTRGTLQITGTVAGYHFEDLGAGTFDEVKMRAYTSAAAGSTFIGWLMN